MRYGVAIPHANRFASGSALDRMGALVEQLGFDSLWVSDHIIVPESSSYIPEHMLEPLAALSHLAARTTHVMLGISVLVIPYRDPVFTAKYLSSLDVLSGGRLVLGVGAGWLREEFDALGASYDERGAQTDEYLEVIRNLWETETSSFAGKWKHYESMRMFPKCAIERRGTIPIWVGGNTAPSIRRAARLGDGWHPINLTPEQLAEGVSKYREECARAGREPGPICLRHMPGGAAPGTGRPVLTGTPEEQATDVRDYAAAGLDELMLSMPWRSLDALASGLRAFMRDVAPRV
jgi:probable F420-dependent oxidoreductase